MRHLVVVNPETMIESKALFQYRGADEGGGVPTLLLEKAGQGRGGRRQNEASGVAYLVGGRIEPGEDAGMRRGSQRGLGHTVGEQNAAFEIGRASCSVRVK